MLNITHFLRMPAWLGGGAEARTPSPRPTSEAVLRAIMDDPHSIEFIEPKDRTHAMCLAAVQSNGHAIKHLLAEERTAQIRLAAVAENGHAVQHLSDEERTPEICEISVMHAAEAIQWLTDEQRTPALCESAMERSAEAAFMLRPQNFTPAMLVRHLTTFRMSCIEQVAPDIFERFDGPAAEDLARLLADNWAIVESALCNDRMTGDAFRRGQPNLSRLRRGVDKTLGIERPRRGTPES